MNGTDAFTIETLEEPSPRRAEALRLVLAARGDSSHHAQRRVHRLEDYVAQQSLVLGPVLGASVLGRLISAVTVIESPGSLGAVFIPAEHTPGLQHAATIALLRHVQACAWERSLAILQALVDPADRAEQNLLAEAGFEFLAELIYLERSAADSCPPTPAPPGLDFVPCSPGHEGLLAQTLELTYEHSRDCPKLTEIRRPSEVVATHRATGIYNPHWWLMATLDGQPAGLLLLAGVHDRRALEVVYMGVVPALRRRGIAQAIMARAVEICRQHDNADLILAVDRDNRPARRLYGRWSLREVARRRAWFAANPDRRPL